MRHEAEHDRQELAHYYRTPHRPEGKQERHIYDALHIYAEFADTPARINDPHRAHSTAFRPSRALLELFD